MALQRAGVLPSLRGAVARRRRGHRTRARASVPPARRSGRPRAGAWLAGPVAVRLHAGARAQRDLLADPTDGCSRQSGRPRAARPGAARAPRGPGGHARAVSLSLRHPGRRTPPRGAAGRRLRGPRHRRRTARRRRAQTLENLATSLSDGSLAFQMGRLAELPLAAVAVEGRYTALLAHAHAPAGWLADQLVRLQTRYPQVPVVFVDSRRHAEDWTHRFLATALTDRQAILDTGPA
jgi:hypothetical protein